MASAAASRPLKRMTALAVALAGVAYGIVRLDKRAFLTGYFTGPGSTSRIIALALVITNFKNFPFVWHYRVWHAIVKQFEISPRKFTPSAGPKALFQPVITSSLSPLTECDYNLHKSNSTYFTDLDVTRSHLFGLLFSQGTKKLQREKNVVYVDGKPHNGRWFVALGAVHCSFKKEIKPYEGYEMWTRVLAWDKKWLYIITHFVKKGAVKPDGYILDDGTIINKPKGGKKTDSSTNGNAAKDPLSNAVFATAIAKYVCKMGRLTLHPEVGLTYSNLLPPKPGGWNTMSQSTTEDVSASSTFEKVEADSTETSGDEWTWQRVEAENEKGLEFARHFAALDGLHEKFSADGPALGVDTDLFFS